MSGTDKLVDFESEVKSVLLSEQLVKIKRVNIVDNSLFISDVQRLTYNVLRLMAVGLSKHQLP